MNISINALYLLLLYAFSPLITNYNTTFTNLRLIHFIPTIFFNTKNLLLENCKFSKGIGSLLYTSPSKILLDSVTN